MRIPMPIIIAVLFMCCYNAAQALPVEKELQLLQDQLLESISSTDPESFEQFSTLTREIVMREKFLRDAGERYVIVNVADYTLRMIERGEERLLSKAIVGRPEQPTPLIPKGARITDVIVNPSWVVTENTALLRIAPRFAEDPNHALAMGYIVYSDWSATARTLDPTKVNWQKYIDKSHIPFKIYQKPGKLNELGTVKFIVPNTDGIFIHGTPYKKLFDSDKREYSSGCIRIREVQDLASLVLDGVSSTVIDTRIKRGSMYRYRVQRPIKMFVVNWEAEF